MSQPTAQAPGPARVGRGTAARTSRTVAALGARVRRAVEEVVEALAPKPGAEEGGPTPRALHAAAIRLVMGHVVGLFAEARGLSAADGGALFASGRAGTDDEAGPAMAALGAPGGALPDGGVDALLDRLTRVEVREAPGGPRVEVPVDYAALPPETLGLLYESLLDFELRRAPADTPVTGRSEAASPGGWSLVRWGGTRKGAGTFYTPPELAVPTARRVLRPLAYVPAAAPASADGGEASRWAPRAPEEILALTVCDPAMGGGSFLLAALRFLTAALSESAVHHGRLEPRGAQTVLHLGEGGPTGAAAEEVLPLPADHPELPDHLEVRLTRRVVERCLYGVDLDPVAVALARTALWLETRDPSLPIDGLDGHLKCGNALVGAWSDDLATYPLAAWDRAGGETPGRAWATRRAEIRRQAEAAPGPGEPGPAEGRAARRRALDTWCALWFWPADRIASAPGPRGFAAAARRPSEIVEGLARQWRFFHWELEFPEVFAGPDGGFDAILGNPPWETLQAEPKEFFSRWDARYRTYSNAEGRRARARLLAEDPALEARWADHRHRHQCLQHWVAHRARPAGARGRGGADRRPFRLQGRGKSYTHLLFLELALRYTKAGGGAGLILPASVSSSRAAAKLRVELATRRRWAWLFELWNRRRVFPIDPTYRFVILVWHNEAPAAALRAAFVVEAPELWSLEDPPSSALRFEDVARTSPSFALPSVAGPDELDCFLALHAGGRPLRELARDAAASTRKGDLNLALRADALLEHDPVRDADEAAPAPGLGASGGAVRFPVVEGRMIGPFDATQKRWVRGRGRGAVWAPGDWAAPRLGPQFWVGAADFTPRGGVRLAVMDVTRATVARTTHATLLPAFWAAADTVNVMDFEGDRRWPYWLCAVLGSLPFDWLAKRRCGGMHLGWNVLEELPVPPLPEWADAVVGLVARLAFRHPAYAPEVLRLRREGLLGEDHRPARTRHEVVRLRALLDALVAEAYGLTPAAMRTVIDGADREVAALDAAARAGRLDAKGLWKVDRSRPPEQRQTVLSYVAHHDLRAEGVEAFLGGGGWQLPETLVLADYGLGHGDGARRARPVAAPLGPRFTGRSPSPWEAWAEGAGRIADLLAGSALRTG